MNVSLDDRKNSSLINSASQTSAQTLYTVLTILWLQIGMHDTDSMQKRQGTGHLVHEPGRIGFRVGAIVDEMLKHFSTRHQVQNEVKIVVVLVLNK